MSAPEKNQLLHEKALLLRIAEGEEEAFTRLFVAYSRILHPFITDIVRSEHIAEEMIQQTFLKLWLKRDQLTEVTYPRAYIFRIASNECFAYLRRKVLEEKHQATITDRQDSGIDSIESHITLRDIQQQVQAAVLRLPPQQQRIYFLSRKMQLKIPEIAEQLAISPLTVKNSLVKSLKFIRTHLEREGFLPLLPLIIFFS